MKRSNKPSVISLGGTLSFMDKIRQHKQEHQQYIGCDRLRMLGFKELEPNLFIVKIGRRITATIALDAKGYVLNHTGLVTDRFGNVVLYRRF